MQAPTQSRVALTLQRDVLVLERIDIALHDIQVRRHCFLQLGVQIVDKLRKPRRQVAADPPEQSLVAESALDDVPPPHVASSACVY